MNKFINFSVSWNTLLRSFLHTSFASVLFFSNAALALEDPFAEIFEQVLESYTDVDTSSVDVLIAETESQSEEQAYNPEVTWEIGASFDYSRTDDRTESILEKENNRVVKTSVTLNKTLWDKALNYSIESAQNNIKVAQINQFGSRQELAESAAIAYLDLLAAKDLTASSQKLSRQLLNLKKKISAKKEQDSDEGISLEDVEDQIQTVQTTLLEEKTNLKKAKIALRQYTNSDNLNGDSSQSYFTAKDDLSLSSELKLIKLAMRNNAELQALHSGQTSLQKNILSKRAGTAPKLDFTSSIAQEWSTGDLDQDLFNVSVGVNMAMPLYTGGRVHNEVKLAQLELLSAERETNLKKREIRAEISTLATEFSGSLSSYKTLLKLHSRLKGDVTKINADISSTRDVSSEAIGTLNDEFELKNSLIREYYGLLKIKVEIMKITGQLESANINQLRTLLLSKGT